MGELRLTQVKNMNIDGGFISNTTRNDLGLVLYLNKIKIGSVNTDNTSLSFETQGLSDVKYTQFV